MKVKRIGIIGLGHVGEAVLKSFRRYSSAIKGRVPLRIEIVKVCDLDKTKRKIAKREKVPFTSNPSDLIDDPKIDIIVELIGGLEPARTYIVEALKKGKDIVTANKALLALKGKDIFSLAKKKKRTIGFEASVCGAIPLIRSISSGLSSCEIKSIYGVLNGTTNYILYQMSKEKINFKEALSEAQNKGFAERKPGLDIKGIDALHKLCILSYLCYGVWPHLSKVYTEGIGKISLLDVLYADELSYNVKLLAIAKKKKNGLDLRVHPTLVSKDHPLSQVALAYNAVCLNAKPAGELLFYGEGAGGLATSSSVISDIISIASGNGGYFRKEEKVPIENIKNIKTRYYIRIMAQDIPGVLAKIAKILSQYKISISSVTQKEKKKGKIVPVVMLTNEVKEDNLMKALKEIDKLKVIKGTSQRIRIENL